jgi:carbamoyl-phosphate synthase large subunit
MKVLVSGVASDIGLNIGRILKSSSLEVELFGSDIHGEYYADDVFSNTVTLPHVSSQNFIEELQYFIAKTCIDVFIPTSEPELRWFSAHPEASKEIGAHCLMASAMAMEIGFDKLRTSQHLLVNRLGGPWAFLVSDLPEGPPEIPCILKSRDGSGNSAVYFVDDPSKCLYYKQLFPGYIWQEYLPSALGEFTCGVYRCLDGSTRVIVMRRRLASGVTAFAEVVQEPAIESLCRVIADSLELHGSINIQLRVVENKGPMVFEINPRFSSTVAMRHYAGFHDVIWAIEENVLNRLPSSCPKTWPLAKFSRRYTFAMATLLSNSNSWILQN